MAQYVYTMNRVGKIVPPKRAILKDISLSFFPGAKIGVLGLNGSGKSTLLRIMAGEDSEFEGEAVPMPGMRIGFLPQEPQLAPEQTVRQAVEEGMGEVADIVKTHSLHAILDPRIKLATWEQKLLYLADQSQGLDSRRRERQPLPRQYC